MGAREDKGTAARRGWARVGTGPGRAILVAGMVVAMGAPASAAPGEGPDAELRPHARVGYTAVDEVTATHGGSSDLFVAGVDARRASEPRAVTDTVGADSVPFAWSPDGTRLAFQAWNRFDLTAEVAVTDAFGGSTRRVADEADSFDWSADGARVVLGHVDRVWTVRDDGSAPREVFRVPHVTLDGKTYAAERVTAVDWAPAGDKVLIQASAFAEEYANAHGSWVVDAGSGESTRIDWASDAEWSADGTKFAARDTDDEGQYELVTASAAQPDKVLARFGEEGWSFTWAPRGYQLAYEVSGPDSPPSESPPPCCSPHSIRVARADGTEDREVASLPTPLALAWSADGSQLAVAGQFGQVTVVDDDGEETVAPHNAVWAVTLADGSVTELWRTTDAVWSMEWLPDGSAIVADTEPWEGHTRHVMVIPTRSGEAYALPRTDGGARAEGPWAAGSAVAPQAFRSTLRVMGPDRVATAVELSRAAFTTADAVVIARADAYPDALAGAPLAAQLQGPLLLSTSDRLDPRVSEEIDRLGATRAVVLGTENVLSDTVVSQLRERGISDVDRIGGADRFATAAMIADRLDRPDEVFLVEGANADPNRGWPDAVAVAGLAAASGRPILLTETATLPAPTRQWLTERTPQRATIVGGHIAVSREVAQHAERLAGAADRIAGADRYETASLVATAAIEHGLQPTTTLAVTGAKWPDSLTAGVAASHLGLVMLMVPPAGLGDGASAAWIRDHAATIDVMALVGGTVALPPAVQREIADLLAR